MTRQVQRISETLASVVAITLAGVACCGPLVLQWLGLALWAIGGRVLLLWLLRYELPILGVIAVAAFVGQRLACDLPTRWRSSSPRCAWPGPCIRAA